MSSHMIEGDSRSSAISIYSPPFSPVPWDFRELVAERPVRYFSFGRLALVEALRLGGVGRRDSVLLPAYLCREVLASLHAVGAKPVYYPVDRNLQASFDPESMPRCKAVLAVNYFGFPQKLDLFDRYCDRVGAFLIEDNAHGLFSRDEEGRLLGTRGDVGIFSLRKTVPLPNGAALVVNRQNLHSKLPEQEPFQMSDCEPFFNRKNKIRRAIGLLGIWSAPVFIRVLRLGRWIMTGTAIPAPNPNGEIVLPEPAKCTPLIQAGIKSAHPELESRRRRGLYSLLEAMVGKMEACTPVFDGLPEGVVPYGYPFFCKDEALKGVKRQFFRKGLLCISWPELPKAITSTALPFYRQTRLAPFLW